MEANDERNFEVANEIMFWNMQLLWRREKIASQERSSSLAKAIGQASENEVGNAWNGTEMCQKPQMLTGMVNIDKQQLTESNCVFFLDFLNFSRF